MKPYFQDESCTIYHGDCREILPHIDRVEFGFADPPYNVGKDYGGWNDSLPEPDYLAFCAEWVRLFQQKTQFACVYTPTKYLTQYWRLLGEQYRQIVLTWNAAGAIRFGFANHFASLLTNAKPESPVKNWWHNTPSAGQGFYFQEETYDHPGYTSEALTRRILAELGPSGTVIDPFCGTGTTLRAAKDRGRKSIGIEFSEAHCETAANRMSQSVLPLTETKPAEQPKDLFAA